MHDHNSTRKLVRVLPRPTRRLTRVNVLLAVAVVIVGLSSSLIAAAAVNPPTDTAATPPTPETPATTPASQLIPGRYIVVFKSADQMRQPADIRGAARNLADRYHGGLGRVYTTALHGFAVSLSDTQARAIRKEPSVAYVQQDTIVHTTTIQANPSWSLDRVDQPNPTLSGTYGYDTDASNVSIYVIDTGVRFSHVEFGGRVQNGPPGVDNNDCAGHGTAVAGAAAATTWGLAKKATIYSVRVLNCAGAGAASDALAAMDWIAANAKRPAVANISWTTGPNSALDDAVRRSIQAGITFTIAAANSSDDACNHSPQRVAEAITVAATDSNDARASWSSYGPCVDLFAPGTDITTAAYTSDTATTTASGTSLSSPIAAGAAALYLAAHPSATPQQVRDALVACASTDIISDPGPGSPNKLLNARCGAPLTVSNPGRQVTVKGQRVALHPLSTTGVISGQTVTYRATGLPAGLSINSATGEIAGTTSDGGESTVEVTATDGAGRSGTASFAWEVVIGNGAITGVGGDCIDDRSSVTSNGNAIQVWTCNQTPAQVWTARSDGRLQALGKCMTVSGDATADGTPIVLSDCGTANSQIWQPQSNGSLLNPVSGRCLNAPSSNWGTQLTLATCNGTANQQWQLPAA